MCNLFITSQRFGFLKVVFLRKVSKKWVTFTCPPIPPVFLSLSYSLTPAHTILTNKHTFTAVSGPAFDLVLPGEGRILGCCAPDVS